MPSILYPTVPYYPGVPELLRPVSAVIAASPVLAIGIGTVENILGSALQQAPRWGIFDVDGAQLGVTGSASVSILSILASQIAGDISPTLSTLDVEFMRETRISDFPLEAGSFASYNKVQMPANPVVTLALAGTEDDRTAFLTAIDAASIGTELYSVVTPEVTYGDYSIERYRYARRSSQGATLLVVEISLKEIRQVTASFATVTAAPIVDPQNAGATPSVSGGITQPKVPDVSTLKSLTGKLGLN